MFFSLFLILHYNNSKQKEIRGEQNEKMAKNLKKATELSVAFFYLFLSFLISMMLRISFVKAIYNF